MTVTVKCQHTGIEFEADSTRTKNHPRVAKFLNEAANNRHQRGAGRQAKAILAQAKGQLETIEEIMSFANAAYTAWCNDPASQTTVMSYKERRDAGERKIASFLRETDGEKEERLDAFGPKYFERHGDK